MEEDLHTPDTHTPDTHTPTRDKLLLPTTPLRRGQVCLYICVYMCVYVSPLSQVLHRRTTTMHTLIGSLTVGNTHAHLHTHPVVLEKETDRVAETSRQRREEGRRDRQTEGRGVRRGETNTQEEK